MSLPAQSAESDQNQSWPHKPTKQGAMVVEQTTPGYLGSGWMTQSLAKAPTERETAPVRNLARQVSDNWGGVAGVNAYRYNIKVANVPDDQPTMRVNFNDCQGKGYTPKVLYEGKNAPFVNVPVDLSAKPAKGGDSEIAFIQGDKIWEFWQYKVKNGKPQACWGGVKKLEDPAFPSHTGATATGISYAQTAVSPADVIRAQKTGKGFGHAVFFAAIDTRKGHRWPAQRSDGGEGYPAPVQGSRFVLPADVDIDRMDLTPFARMVALTAKEQGLVLGDKASAVTIGTVADDKFWKGFFGDTPDYRQMRNFPWDELRVADAKWVEKTGKNNPNNPTPEPSPSQTTQSTPNVIEARGHHRSKKLTWKPPRLSHPKTVNITKPGTVNLDPRRDYIVKAKKRINGAVHLHGGRNVKWVGGHIRIPDAKTGTSPSKRRGLMISDAKHGSRKRTVHIEGLRIDGKGLTEGIDLATPTAVVQLQNITVGTVAFKSGDDRDGTGRWRSANHPDVIQIWGATRELRVDGLDGKSNYQGIYLAADRDRRQQGNVYLRNITLGAVETRGTDGARYAGQRMFSFDPNRMNGARIFIDRGTVRVRHHKRGGWDWDRPNPHRKTNLWRGRFREGGRYVRENPPGKATFEDTFGHPRPKVKGDRNGKFAYWPNSQVRDWGSPSRSGRIYQLRSKDKPAVKPGLAGTKYRSPGYRGR